jgi:two-component system, cell cycle sensor histidine kinase and response regulator CckA
VELVITDIVMPGMSGPDLVNRLRRQGSGPPVLFMAGAISPRSAASLPGPFLLKPFSEDSLLQQVRRILG